MRRSISAVITMLALYNAAWAQVTATPVRPAKGASFTVFNAVTSFPTTSSQYDFNAFTAVQLIVNPSPPSCTSVTVAVQGSVSFGGTYIQIVDTAASVASSGSATNTYIVDDLPPYVQFVASAPVGPCILTVTAVPLPFASGAAQGKLPHNSATVNANNLLPVIVAGIDTSGTARVRAIETDNGGRVEVINTATTTTQIAPTQTSVDTTASGTTVYAGAATTCETTVQNASIVAMTCGTGNVTAGGPGAILKAASSATAGDGGSMTFRSGAAIKCIAASSSGNINVQPISCAAP